MSCITYPQDPEACCPPYVLTDEDRIRQCVNAELFKLVEPRLGNWCATIEFGTKGLNEATAFMADVNELADHVMRVWHHRQSDANAASGDDRGVGYYWNTYKFSSIMRYFKCMYSVSIDPILLQAGIIDPDREWQGKGLPEPNACELVNVPSYEPPVPPEPPDPELLMNAFVVSNCALTVFTVNVNVTSIIACQGSGIEVYVDNVLSSTVPVAMGTTPLGPFNYNSVVELNVVNTLTPACEQQFGPFVDPRFPNYEVLVFEARDAAYESSADSAKAYLIISDDTSAGNTWAGQVNKVVYPISDFVLEDDDTIIKAQNPLSPLSYYQMMSGVPVVMFPRLRYVYNTVTGFWTVYPPDTVATFTAGLTVTVGYLCGSVFHTVYEGLLSGFVETGFEAECAFINVTPQVRYNTSCPIYVNGIIETYTPTGDPDPDFDDGGLNDVVFALGPSYSGRVYVGGAFSAFGATPANCFTRLMRDGSLDATYNTNLGTGFNSSVIVIGVGPDGKALVGGNFTDFNGTALNRFARVNVDGTPDTAFNTAIGTAIGSGLGLQVSGIAVQSDGKIILTGNFTDFNGTSTGRIIRLNANGTIDYTFNGNGTTITAAGFNAKPERVHIDFDGTIVCNSGFASTYNGVSLGAGYSLLRINPVDGSLMQVIAQGAQFDAYFTEWDFQPDGKVVVAGQFVKYNTISCPRIARINAMGDLDTAFMTNVSSGFSADTTTPVYFPNGQILIGIFNPATTYAGLPTNGLVRLNADGTRDMAFNTGAGYNGRTQCFTIDSFGALWVGGGFTTVNGLPRLRVNKII